MVIHLTVAALQFAALAAILIFWHFWVKKNLRVPHCPDDADRALLPYRRLSRVLLGLVFLTCLVQIYCLWASSTIHEKIASVTTPGKKQEQNNRAIRELKGMIENLREETASNSRLLHAMKSDQSSGVRATLQNSDSLSVPAGGMLEGQARPNPQTGTAGREEEGFAKEAKASSVASIPRTIEKRFEARADSSEHNYSMRLNRRGHVTTEKLRVHKRPQQDAEVIEKLLDGQKVKVTEKRLLNDTMWFRVITPSGRAGWVDFRYLALDGGA